MTNGRKRTKGPVGPFINLPHPKQGQYTVSTNRAGIFVVARCPGIPDTFWVVKRISLEFPIFFITYVRLYKEFYT